MEKSHSQGSAIRRSAVIRALALCAILSLLFSTFAIAQDVTVTLPGASALTGVFDGENLVIEERTVPAGYMQLFQAYDGSYRDPVVIIEGFDPTNNAFPSDLYAKLNTWGGLDIIRAAGKSVWIVNFGDGGGALTANAKLVSHAIQTAANWGGLSNAKVDVIGISMGGVIGRYALAYDEHHGGGSDGLVRLFISGDSPQQGANGPPSLQKLILFTEDPELAPLLGCDAALSMLYTSVRSYQLNNCSAGALPSSTNWTGSSAAHDWFYSTLNSLNVDGYPKKSRNVAVANGNLTPRAQQVGDPIYQARTYLDMGFSRIRLCTETYHAYAMDVAPGSLGGDFAPGNIREPFVELDEYFIATFIPTDSALDIRNGVSMFDRALYQNEQVDHGVITLKTTDFLLEESLGPERIYNPNYLPDGVNATIYDWIVTAKFPGVFYAQSPDRLAGLCVVSWVSVEVDNIVTVRGIMSTVQGERRLQASSVDIKPETSTLAPLGLPNRALGGGPLGYYVTGITGATGLNNIGLLIRSWGEVTHAGTGFFYIDDGSNLEDGSEHKGVRIETTGVVPNVGNVVQVTGISSCYLPGDGTTQRRIRARAEQD